MNNYLNHGGDSLPDGAALTRSQYYVTTGTISLFSPFCSYCAVSYTPLLKNVIIAADKPGMWASSGEIRATSHLLESRIGCFGVNSDSGSQLVPIAKTLPRCTNHSAL